MPICGRIRHFERLEGGPLSPRIGFRFTIHDYSRDIPFHEYVERAIPTARVVQASHSAARFTINAVPESAPEVEALLDLWRTSVTILDDADESHALGLHSYRYPGARTRPTALGNLVYRAKYRSASTHAHELGRRCVSWMAAHPRYRKADCIAVVPSSGPESPNALPNILADEIGKAFHLERIPMTTAPRQPQKGLSLEEARANVRGKFSVQGNLDNRTVVLIDDLYDSGSTINEGVDALRSANAVAVLALTASKTAHHCEGLRPYARNWELEEQRDQTFTSTENLPFE